MITRTLLFSLFFCLSLVKAQTAPQPFPFAEIHTLESKEMGETRMLNVWFPTGYSPDSAAKYPVIYVLDGSVHEDFQHIAGLVQFMNMYDLTPKSIVVGIENVNRYRDFTHPTQSEEDKKYNPDGGGSAKFIAFLEKEAQPYIDQHFKTNGKRTIIGQSLGGLVAAEILLNHPDLFDAYIMVSPSTWWNDESLLNSADDLLTANPLKNKRVYIAYGKEHPVMMKGAKKLYGIMKKNAGTDSKVLIAYFPKEDHATILHRAAYDGLEKLSPKPFMKTK